MKVYNGDLPNDTIRSYNHCDHVACDIETSGLDKQHDRIACIQIYNSHVGAVMVRNLENPNNILNLLQSNNTTKLFHYAGFDLAFLMRDYPDLQPRCIIDTKIAAKILDPNKQQFYDPYKKRNSHSLAALAHSLCNIRLDKSTATSNWFNEELTPEQLRYAEQDVKYLYTIWMKLMNPVIGKNMQWLILDSCDYIPTQIRLELLGYKDVFGY